MRGLGLILVSVVALSCAGAVEMRPSPDPTPLRARDEADKRPSERAVQRIAGLACDDAVRAGLEDGLHPILLYVLERRLLICAPVPDPNARQSEADRARASRAAYAFFVAVPNAINEARGLDRPSYSFLSNRERRTQAVELLRAWMADSAWDEAVYAKTKLDPLPLAALSLDCDEIARLAPASRAGLELARSLAAQRRCGADLLGSHARAGLGGSTMARGYVCGELGAARIHNEGWGSAILQAAVTDVGTRTCVSQRPWRTFGQLFAGICDEWKSSHDGRLQCLATFGKTDHAVYIDTSLVDGGEVTFKGYYIGVPRFVVAVTSDSAGAVKPGMVFSSNISAELPEQAKAALLSGSKIRPMTLGVRTGPNYQTPTGNIQEITMTMRGAPAISPMVPIIVDEDGSVTVGSPR